MDNPKCPAMMPAKNTNVLSLISAIGLGLGKIHVCGISLGVTFVLDVYKRQLLISGSRVRIPEGVQDKCEGGFI